jgi:septal ring factor EnvC (AmiA/AmiB activator)
MTSETITTILLAILACAWLGDFVRGLFQRQTVKADANLSDANATQVIVTTATTMLEPLSARVKEAEGEAAKLRQELRDARSEVGKLISQLQECTAENKRVTAENKRLRLELRGGVA